MHNYEQLKQKIDGLKLMQKRYNDLKQASNTSTAILNHEKEKIKMLNDQIKRELGQYINEFKSNSSS